AGHLALSHELIETQRSLVAFAVPEPADARWKPLKFDVLSGSFDPPVEMLVIGEEFEDRLVGYFDVFRITGEGYPTEGSLALTEQGADISGNKPGEGECAVITRLTGLIADGV